MAPPAVTMVMMITMVMPMVVVVSRRSGIDRIGSFAEWGYWSRDGARYCRKSQTGDAKCRQDNRPHVLLPDSCGYALAENLQSRFWFQPALFAVQSVGEGREHGCVMT
jgi:hypothetical protein